MNSTDSALARLRCLVASCACARRHLAAGALKPSLSPVFPCPLHSTPSALPRCSLQAAIMPPVSSSCRSHRLRPCSCCSLLAKPGHRPTKPQRARLPPLHSTRFLSLCLVSFPCPFAAMAARLQPPVPSCYSAAAPLLLPAAWASQGQAWP